MKPKKKWRSWSGASNTGDNYKSTRDRLAEQESQTQATRRVTDTDHHGINSNHQGNAEKYESNPDKANRREAEGNGG